MSSAIPNRQRVDHGLLTTAWENGKHTPLTDVRALSGAPAPKELWEISDAGHYDFERHAPEAYRARVRRSWTSTSVRTDDFPEQSRSALTALISVGIEQAVHVHDVVAHLGVINGALRGALPGPVRLGVVQEDADDVEFRQVQELGFTERFQFATENKMQKLLRWFLRGVPAMALIPFRLSSMRTQCIDLQSLSKIDERPDRASA